MNANRHVALDELTLFALQLLEPDEAEAVLLHVSHCEQCWRELAAVQGDLALLALTAELHSPPSLARERLFEQLHQETEARQLEEPARTRSAHSRFEETRAPHQLRGSGNEGQQRELHSPGHRLFSGALARMLPWVGWAVAAGLAPVAGTLLHERDGLRETVAAQRNELQRMEADASAARDVLETLTGPNAMRVTLTRSRETPFPVGRVNYLPDRGSLVFVATSMAQLGPYKTYELWPIPADGRDPMPAGTFVPDTQGNASVIVSSLPKGVAAKAFGITVEDGGGSTTPTMPIILAGT